MSVQFEKFIKSIIHNADSIKILFYFCGGNSSTQQFKTLFMDYSKITIDLTKHFSSGGSVIEVSDSSFIDLPTLESYLPTVLPYLTNAIISSLNETKEFTIGIHIQFSI